MKKLFLQTNCRSFATEDEIELWSFKMNMWKRGLFLLIRNIDSRNSELYNMSDFIVRLLIWNILEAAHFEKDDEKEACFCYTVECFEHVDDPEKIWETFLNTQDVMSALQNEVCFGTSPRNRGDLWNRIVLSNRYTEIHRARLWFEDLIQEHMTATFIIISKWMKEVGSHPEMRNSFSNRFQDFMESAAECRDWLYRAERISEMSHVDSFQRNILLH